MKKTVFLIIGIIYSLASFGQQSVALNDAVNINIPKGAEKISKEQALSHAIEKFNNNKIVLNSITQRNSEYIYKVDNVLISLFTDNHTAKEGHLLAIKKGFDEMYKGDTTYSSSLTKVNKNSVLIIGSFVKNIGRYDFFSFNTNNTRAITGVVEFNKTDAGEARVILDQLIKSIKFKE